MANPPECIYIIAGEVSGDMHGAHLVDEIKKLHPDIDIKGVGGDRMIEKGLQNLFHIKQLAFLGIGEVIRHLPFIRKVFKRVTTEIQNDKPEAVILIDYPGFNLRLAGKVKRLGIPVIYYISPQIWAWGKRRVHKIKKYVDLMLVIFPFEQDFYNRYGVPVHYVGHPLVDAHYDRIKTKKMQNGNITVGLLPGSRLQEVDHLLPDMLKSVAGLKQQGKINRVMIARVNHIPLSVYQVHIGNYDFVEVYNGELPEFYNQLDAAIVSSGTATLETAYFRVPLVIVYRVSPVTWFLGKILVSVDYIGMANIVAGEKVAEELLQDELRVTTLTGETAKLLDPENNKASRKRLAVISKKMGVPGASKRAACYISEFMGSKEK